MVKAGEAESVAKMRMASAVVGDLHNQVLVLVAHTYRGSGGVGVLVDVGQGFTDHEIRGDLQPLPGRHCGADRQRGAIDQVLYGGGQPVVDQHG